MKIDDTMVAVSSRIRLARNFDGYFFPSVIRGKNEEKQIVSFVYSLLKRFGNYQLIEMNGIEEIEKSSLMERYLISPYLSESPNGAVCLSPDKFISIMINEEDHLREQCILPGLNLKGAYKKIADVDKLIGNYYRFVKSGSNFITACPSNLGTGMRASVMVFLPALCYADQIESIVFNAKQRNITVRGAFGEGSRAEGFWFQISNSKTLCSVNEIIDNVQQFVLELCDAENDERYKLYNKNSNAFEDACLRAFGILKHAKLLSYEECVELIGKVKLGNALEFIKLKNPTALDDLLVSIRPSTLATFMGGYDDVTRANCVKNALKIIE